MTPTRLPTPCAAALVALLLACAPASAQTDNCEPIRAGIEARMRAGGMAEPQLQVVDAGASAPGRVVGSCGNGARKIMLTGTTGAAAAAAPARPASAPVDAARPRPRPAAASKDDDIPTECRDGTVVMGPNCHDPQAPRLPGVGGVAERPAPAASR